MQQLDAAQLKKMIVKSKLATIAVEMAIDKLQKDTKTLAKEAIDKKAAGDKRGAIQVMFKRRLIMKRIKKYEVMMPKLVAARDKLVIILTIFQSYILHNRLLKENPEEFQNQL